MEDLKKTEKTTKRRSRRRRKGLSKLSRGECLIGRAFIRDMNMDADA
jgi:hypothetical protein